MLVLSGIFTPAWSVKKPLIIKSQAEAKAKATGGEITPGKGKSPDLLSFLHGAKSGTQEALKSVHASETTRTRDEDKLGRVLKHIKRFFAKYPKFNYDPNKPYTEEFIRMTKEFNWTRYSEEYRNARKKLNTASVLQFNENFDSGETGESNSGGNKKKSESGGSKKSNSGDKKKKSESEDRNKGKTLRKWVKLFNRIDLKDPVMPKTVREFEERVKSVHANICDVLHTDVAGGKATDWGNEVILSEYTLRTDKIFPRDHPLAGTLLRHLLRHINSPSATRGFEETSVRQK
ncbi:unnamed protein product [Rhizoctonia solani]|uniref:Uncharacterized protein n=1 Tax=Rhizoctonia solani TaxID=456999 RepID=A0A8H3B0A0_9AGAM|nr:unnamed protein product [Rhizoctonia solani]